jgi:hypothetical protein
MMDMRHLWTLLEISMKEVPRAAAAAWSP